MKVTMRKLSMYLLFAAHPADGFSFRGSGCSPISTRNRQYAQNGRTELSMALTPIGPFCPFRSKATESLDGQMQGIKEQGPDFASEMTKFQLDIQMGQQPEPERLRTVAEGINQAVDEWETLVARLRLSTDFQTREYAKLTQAHLQTHGMTVESVGSMMRWQAGCMKAMADNTPPPMPPPDLDLSKMMEQAQQGDESKSSPSISAMAAAEQITSQPFKDLEILESPEVKKEYEKLCNDHSGLIEFGSKYDTFDPLGKLRFLEEIEKIEERWDVFFARFSLMGELNEDYLDECNAFLEGMSMNETEYRKLLKRSHQIMRADAEAERSRLGL